MTTFALNLGTAKAGLTDLRAKLLDSSAQQISVVSTGFTEIDNGQYSWTYAIPSTASLVRFYSLADSTHPYCTLAIQGGAIVPASGDTDTRNAYLYTRDSEGDLTTGATVYYQRIGVDPTVTDAWDDEVHDVESDSNGLATIVMAVASYYKYWIGNGRFRTVHITADTDDPYALPEVTG